MHFTRVFELWSVDTICLLLSQGGGCLNCQTEAFQYCNCEPSPLSSLCHSSFGTETNSIPGLFFFAFLQRQGRCDTYATEFDLEAEEYVPLPKGDVHKKKEIIQDVTLHDLDVANARPQVPDSTDEVFTRKLLYMDVIAFKIIKEMQKALRYPKLPSIGRAACLTLKATLPLLSAGRSYRSWLPLWPSCPGQTGGCLDRIHLQIFVRGTSTWTCGICYYHHSKSII